MATDEKGGSVISKNKSSRSGYTDNTESMSSGVWASLFFDSGATANNYIRQDIGSQFP